MNLIPSRIGRVNGHSAEIDLDHGQTLTADFPVPPKPGSTITLGIRPEHLIPAPPGQGVLWGQHVFGPDEKVMRHA